MTTYRPPGYRQKMNKRRREARAKVTETVRLWKRVVQAVVDEHSAVPFEDGGAGVSADIYIEAEIHDGRNVAFYRFLAAYGHALVIDDAFSKAMGDLPGLIDFEIHLD